MIKFYNNKYKKEAQSLQYKDYELSFWLSEMDMIPPLTILNTFQESYNSGLGYSYINKEYKKAISKWFLLNFHIKIDETKIGYSPSILYTISRIIYNLKISDEDILILTPAFGEYSNLINIDKVIKIDLKSDWLTDIKNSRFKMILLCNPNNPTGKVFNRKELHAIVKICKEKGAWIVSDEVYMDFVFNKSFIPCISYEYEKIISLHSCSKTFNISGIIGSYFISNDKIELEKINRNISIDGLNNPNNLHVKTLINLYNLDSLWLRSVREQIESNYRLLIDKLDTRFICSNLEGTYSVIIDYSNITVSEKIFKNYLLENHMKVMLGGKFILKDSNKCFFRLNLACSPNKLSKGIIILNNLIEYVCQLSDVRYLDKKISKN